MGNRQPMSAAQKLGQNVELTDLGQNSIISTSLAWAGLLQSAAALRAAAV